MCELKVVVNGKKVFENAIYAKTNDNNVVVKDIMGQTKDFKNHRILEVNIASEQLTLSPIK
ncbi:MAG: CooT family nickel-binding protein [archaeon]|jgi:predicted RNA-binding protein|nr:CooT family nickel-binding protein [Candidatus Bathyarchaeum sp.]